MSILLCASLGNIGRPLAKILLQNGHIKFVRPVGIYTNMFSFIRSIKTRAAIVFNYGGDRGEPWAGACGPLSYKKSHLQKKAALPYKIEALKA